MANCRKCGKELPRSWSTDICLECSRANVQKIFKENPDVRQAFQESIDEMRKPENINKMADKIVGFMQAVQSVQKQG